MVEELASVFFVLRLVLVVSHVSVHPSGPTFKPLQLREVKLLLARMLHVAAKGDLIDY